MRKTLLLTILILNVFFLHAQLTKGLIAYYPFNGNTLDSSGHHNNGTGFDLTPAADRFGNENHAYLFNGTSSYVLIPNSTSLQSPGVNDRITQTAWIYLNGLSLTGSKDFGPVTMKSSTNANSFMYRMGVNMTSVFASYNNWNIGSGGVFNFNLHQWYFIATSFDGVTAKTWVNDSLISTASLNTSIPTDNLDLTIGIDVPGIIEHFNGIIDDVRIYDRALKQIEIDSLANPIPTASLPDKSIKEGNSGTTAMKFKLTLDQPYNKVVSINWTTADSTANAGEDYIAANGTLSFQPGQTSKIITVQVIGDLKPEKNEFFKIVLSNPKNVFLANTIALGKIINDDGVSASEVSDIALNNVSNKFSITAYPVPATDFTILNIQNKTGNVNISLTNTDGKIIWQQHNISVNKIKIALQNIPAGSYRITAIDANNNISSIQIIRPE
jgi:hypothetical protein